MHVNLPGRIKSGAIFTGESCKCTHRQSAPLETEQESNFWGNWGEFGRWKYLGEIIYYFGRKYLGSFSVFWERRLKKGRHLFQERKVHPRHNPGYAYVRYWAQNVTIIVQKWGPARPWIRISWAIVRVDCATNLIVLMREEDEEVAGLMRSKIGQNSHWLIVSELLMKDNDKWRKQVEVSTVSSEEEQCRLVPSGSQSVGVVTIGRLRFMAACRRSRLD